MLIIIRKRSTLSLCFSESHRHMLKKFTECPKGQNLIAVANWFQEGRRNWGTVPFATDTNRARGVGGALRCCHGNRTLWKWYLCFNHRRFPALPCRGQIVWFIMRRAIREKNRKAPALGAESLGWCLRAANPICIILWSQNNPTNWSVQLGGICRVNS